MPRPLRTAPGGFVYHVLNRANGKRRIFEHDRDYLAFERVLGEVQERIPMLSGVTPIAPARELAIFTRGASNLSWCKATLTC